MRISDGTKKGKREGMIFLTHILREKDIEEAEKEKVTNCIMENIADNFCIEKDVDFLCDCNINTLNKKIKSKLSNIDSYEDWLNGKEEIINMILTHNIC